MTDLVQQIEEMRLRMNQLTTSEQSLVRALGDALSRADEKLLQDVRTVAAEHETRRAGILRELQSLSARMGALPRPRGPFAAAAEALPSQPARGGDWRQATANIEDEVVLHLKGRAAAS
jgi:hypothetical protein